MTSARQRHPDSQVGASGGEAQHRGSRRRLGRRRPGRVQRQGEGAAARRGLRTRLLLRGQAGLQHLPRQPDLGAVGGEPAQIRREGHAVGSVRRHDHLDDAEEHGARLHLQRFLGALLARRRCEHRDEGAERARQVGPGLRPRGRDPERVGRRRLRRRWVPDRHLRCQLDGDGPRVRPRDGRARRRVLREAGHLHRARVGQGRPDGQHQPLDAQVEEVREPLHAGPDRNGLAAPATTRARSRPGGATARTSACSRAAARGRRASTGR